MFSFGAIRHAVNAKSVGSDSSVSYEFIKKTRPITGEGAKIHVFFNLSSPHSEKPAITFACITSSFFG